ncbi:MAG TPA: hydrogenase formation protein HypD [Candidatus Methanofastidiosa archaeon]|nr:hydrogenase formation protein HypD [Candidatus Methanofastidiosa archaeon]
MNKDRLNDPHAIKLLSRRAHELSSSFDEVKLMHVCGTHEHSIVESGLRALLPENVRLVSGPGCPVCITPKEDIEKMIHLADKGLTVTTFGDMMNIPSDSGSLSDAKSRGGDVRIVYGIANSLALAAKGKEVVHFGIGFETTVPTSSVALMSGQENFSILSVHRTIPEAMEFLLESDIKVDGFIDPGHVSSIIGVGVYRPLSEKYGVPQVVAGFEPGDIMLSVVMLLEQLHDGRAVVENEYARAVRENGNTKAISMMEETFEHYDAKWRALPTIPNSGLRIRKGYSEMDALKRHEDLLGDFEYVPRKEESGCRCADMLLGNCSPEDCPLYRGICSPDNPVGPCMVSIEGTCNIAYKYGQ